MIIWDVYNHANMPGRTPLERIATMLKYADRVGIERLVVYANHVKTAPETFRRENDEVMEIIRNHGDRVFGFVYVNPQYGPESLDEIRRCVAEGPMVGVKLGDAVRCNRPEVDPIVESAVALKAVVFQDNWFNALPTPPYASTPNDLIELSRRHPGAPLISSHAGGNWELGIRALRPAKDIWTDVSGCEPTAGFVEMAVRELGPERLLYGSEASTRSFAAAISKVISANIPDRQKQMIFRDNFRGLLLPQLDAKGIKT